MTIFRKPKIFLYNILKKSEKWTKTDMLYLVKGGFWLTLSKTVGTITAFSLAIAYANLLPKETYATYKYVISISGLLSIFTLSGMSTALTRSVARGYEGVLKKVIKTKLKFGLFGLIAGFCFSGYYFYQGNNTLAISLAIASIFATLSNSLIIHGSYLSGKKNFKLPALFSSFKQIIFTIAITVLILFNKNVIYLLTVYFTFPFFIQLYFSYFTYKKYKPNNKIDSGTISFGKHLSLLNILGTVAEHIDKIFLWHLLGPTELAIYSFAVMPVEQLRSFIKSTQPMALPKLAKQNFLTLKNTLPKKILFFTISILFFSSFYILLAPYIFKTFFSEYFDSILYSQIYSLSLIFFPLGFFSTALAAHAKKKQLYILKILNPSIKITLMLILISYFGIMGAVLAKVLAPIISFPTTYLVFNKK